ncbi:pyridoxine 4-dehydrogenase [Jimgerdemannia flammicorona]|uniref:Pyridoxine 4-dehydrogenase n=1 Tax=Jimgerdemannia flammicorona TaxID=994334 RepID=A0A433QHT7_9FUNG|nr:pyridoxine 4-dehydrogenase [Jimgerdemannia flammicorona]
MCAKNLFAYKGSPGCFRSLSPQKMPIPHRELGRTGTKVAAIGLGCMGLELTFQSVATHRMSEFYGLGDEKESIAVLERSVDLGANFWDTADMYGTGKNEELLAKVLKTRRSEVFLATKFGNVRGPNGEFLGVNGTPEYVRQALEASLRRLQVDYVDLYYQHRVDPNVPIEDTVRAMAELVKEGKVRYLGLSECSAATLRRAYAVHPIAALQMEYSPWTLDIEENGILETARELGKWGELYVVCYGYRLSISPFHPQSPPLVHPGVTIVAYSPLGRGMLTGQYKSSDDFEENDFRRTAPRFNAENFPKNLDLVRRFDELAKAKGITSSQLVLAWVLAQGQDFIPIPGTKRIKYLEENVGAANVTLSEHELKEIRKIINSIGVHGMRYQHMGGVGL